MALVFLNLHMSVFQFLKLIIVLYGIMRHPEVSNYLTTCTFLHRNCLSAQVTPTEILYYPGDLISISWLVTMKMHFIFVFFKCYI